MWKISQQVDKDSLGKTFSGELGFARHFASHMFLAEFDRKQGWLRPRIQAYDKFQLSPAATVLHDGQALFEGLKAFRQKDSSLAICRPEFNWKRMSEGA